MKFAHVAATALAVGALLAGCSPRHSSSRGYGSPASPGPGEGETTPRTTNRAAPTPSSAPDLDDWPTRPATADKFPRSIRSTALGENYTGTAYLGRLTQRWHIDLGARKKNDFNKNDDVPPVWYAAGTGRPSPGAKLTVAAVWDLSGDLESLTCTADRTAPGRTDFLRACIQLNYPRAQPTSAVRWLGKALPDLDTAYAHTKKPVGSPLYRSGRAASYLLEYDNGEEGLAYSVRIFGTAS